MKLRNMIMIYILWVGLIGCDHVDENTVAIVGKDNVINVQELEKYHASQLFARRFPNAELEAFPMALDELVVREMKIIDFFEKDLDQDSLLMLNIRRSINEELVQVYFDKVFFPEFIEERRVSGSKEELKNRYLDTALEGFDNFKEKLVNRKDITWNEEAIGQLTLWANREDFFLVENPRYRDILADTLDSGYNPIIFSYKNREVDLVDYQYYLNEILVLANNSNPSKQVIKEFLLEAERTSRVLEKARENELDANFISKESKNAFLRQKFVELYNYKMIFEPIPQPTEENLKAFYDQQKTDQLYQFSKRIIYVSLYDTEEAAQLKWDEFKSGKTFEELTNKSWQVKSYIRDEDGEIKSVNSSEKAYLGEVAFSLDEEEVAGPIEVAIPNEGTRYAIVKCSIALEEKVLEYFEVENIQKKLRDYYINKNNKQVVQMLRNTYSVKLFENRLKDMVQS